MGVWIGCVSRQNGNDAECLACACTLSPTRCLKVRVGFLAHMAECLSRPLMPARMTIRERLLFKQTRTQRVHINLRQTNQAWLNITAGRVTQKREIPSSHRAAFRGSARLASASILPSRQFSQGEALK